MSRDFIGSKIAIITKSQCRYVGTIIGIDTQTSSVLLGNVKCFGMENRAGSLTNAPMTGTILPIMQFANSDIEDLKVVDDDQPQETLQQQNSMPTPSVTLPPSSIHDDPAIVSACVSSTYKDKVSNPSTSSQLIHNLQNMTLLDEKPAIKPKIQESSIHSDSGELVSSWPLSSQSNWETNTNSAKLSSQQSSDNNKSKFFDNFTLDNNSNNISTQRFQSNRTHQHVLNTNLTQLPVRQPFYSNDNPYPQAGQQHNRYQGDNMQHKQRHFHNNHRGQRSHYQRHTGSYGSGGNREAFLSNPNDIDDDFDFESSNRNFHKLTNDDELKPEIDLTTNRSLPLKFDNDTTAEHPSIYDKKKSFFDNLTVTEQSDAQKSHGYNRSNANGYRRTDNYNFRQNQYGNDDFHYKQHNNNKSGYNYRY